MPDCCLCGAYIERGAGHRRKVQTGTSTRVYMTKRGGACAGRIRMFSSMILQFFLDPID